MASPQILNRGDGTGPEAMSLRTQALPKNEGAKIARSISVHIAQWVAVSLFITRTGNWSRLKGPG
jgi:hypothetical protein